ncbi:hypothetical protein BDV93DRAFT_527826 [Ceratobasidium sp. AG-I]|nr:hypothetical protein BDV93DRAFT_527826 [Ceratobasidium sp. AG-I]
MASNSPELVAILAHLGPAFDNAAKCLATVSDSLSTAAQGLAEAAQSLSEANRFMRLPSHTLDNSDGERNNDKNQSNLAGVSASNILRMDGRNAGTFENEPPSLPRWYIRAISKDTSAFHYYLVLRDDSSALPLIGYFANQGRKTICFVSHHSHLTQLKKILDSVTTATVECTSRRQKPTEDAILRFLNSYSSLLMLHGDRQVASSLEQIAVDTVLHWGFPPEELFIPQINLPNAARTVLILPPNEGFVATNPILQANGVVEHPYARQLTKLTLASPFPPVQERTLARFGTTYDTTKDPETLSPRGKKKNFSRVPSTSPLHYYIALQEDFDIIPFIAYIANQAGKTICFVSHHCSLHLYKKILSTIVDGEIDHPKEHQNDTHQTITKFGQSNSRLLLLKGDRQASPALENINVDTILHWGFPSERFFTSQIKLPKSTQTILILSVDEGSKTTSSVLQANGVIEHPEANRLTALTTSSPLFSMRARTTVTLGMVTDKTIRQVYAVHLAGPGTSPLDVARRANRFVARVLLHGDSSDGSAIFKPVGERPLIAAGLVQSGGLHLAVSRGLVRVVGT